MARKTEIAKSAQQAARARCIENFGGHNMVNVGGKGEELIRCSRCDSVPAVNAPHRQKAKTAEKLTTTHKVALTRKDGKQVNVFPWTIAGR